MNETFDNLSHQKQPFIYYKKYRLQETMFPPLFRLIEVLLYLKWLPIKQFRVLPQP